jgi:acylphosphatase
MIARRVRVSGRVQGVFFRAWTRDEARSLGVSGWVRNCSDGSVEAHLEGTEAAVRQMVDRLHDGPSQARVDQVNVNEAATEELDTFDVRH